jgi:hypothetical protein
MTETVTDRNVLSKGGEKVSPLSRSGFCWVKQECDKPLLAYRAGDNFFQLTLGPSLYKAVMIGEILQPPEE